MSGESKEWREGDTAYRLSPGDKLEFSEHGFGWDYVEFLTDAVGVLARRVRSLEDVSEESADE